METEVVQALLSPWTLAILGLCIGSFLNVVIHRLPVMLERDWKLDSADMLGVKVDVPAQITLSTPRSRCPSCGHPIAWHENIPVLSYLWGGLWGVFGGLVAAAAAGAGFSRLGLSSARDSAMKFPSRCCSSASALALAC